MAEKLMHTVIRMHSGGMSPKEIAEKLGKTARSIHQVVFRARTAGLLAPVGGQLRRKHLDSGYGLLEWKFNGTNRAVGSMKSVLFQLTPDHLSWLDKITPEGSSAANVIASIIIDAYHDDTEVKALAVKEMKQRMKGIKL